MKCLLRCDNLRDVRHTYVVAQAKIYRLIWLNFSFISKVQLSIGKYTLITWTANIVLKREQKRIFLSILNITGSLAMKYVIVSIYLPYQVNCKREPFSSNIASTSKDPSHGRAFKISTALVYVRCSNKRYLRKLEKCEGEERLRRITTILSICLHQSPWPWGVNDLEWFINRPDRGWPESVEKSSESLRSTRPVTGWLWQKSNWK